MMRKISKRGKSEGIRSVLTGLAAAIFITFTVPGGYMNLVGHVGLMLCIDAESRSGIDVCVIYKQPEIWRVFCGIADTLKEDG